MDGERGALRVLQILRDELELALALSGCAAPAAVTARAPPSGAYAERIFGGPWLDGSRGTNRFQRVHGIGRAVLGRLRQRRLLDLLRARGHRRLRAGADPGRLRDRRADLHVHRRLLHGGHRDVPGGGRLLELRPPRLQRAGQLLRRLGADAQLRDHGRDLGLLRAPLPGRLLGAAREPARRHALRHRADRGAGGAQRQGDPGVLAFQPGACGGRPRDPDRAGR